MNTVKQSDISYEYMLPAIAALIEFEREKQNMSLRELARKSGITVSAFSHFLNSTTGRDIQMKTLSKICEAF